MFGAMSLTSCENDSNEIQNTKQNQENLISSKRMMAKTSDDQLIENAINLVKNQSSVKYSARDRNPIDSLIIEEPENPETPINQENGTILCGVGVGNPVGFACVKNDAGKLVRVSWQPLHYQEMPNLMPSNEFNPIIYTGTVVSQCNC